MTTSSVSKVSTTGEMVWTPCSADLPSTGLSQCCRPAPSTSNPPAKTEPTARTIIGMVIIFGDSCGWNSGFQRRLPWNVMTKIRVM